MSACDTWKVEINILVSESEMFFLSFTLRIEIKFNFQCY